MGLTVQKTSSGAHSYALTANTGRNQKTFRSRVQTATAGDGTNDHADTVYIQSGKDEFVQLVSAQTRTIGKDITSVEIQALSNSTKINATFLSNTMSASISSITINGSSYTNNSVIAGDPGASAQYTIVITLTFKANGSASTRAFSMQIADNAGHAVTTTITQEADDPAISVSPSSVTVAATGGSGSVAVTSNDDWSVSVVNSNEQQIVNEE